jgi:hypothetical protein
VVSFPDTESVMSQDIRLVGLYAVHQGSILPVPEAGLAPAVPGDDRHVPGDGQAPDVALCPARSHPSSWISSLNIPDPIGVRSACGYVHPITVPGQAEDLPMLSVQLTVVVEPLRRDVEQADNPSSVPTAIALSFSEFLNRSLFLGHLNQILTAFD